MRRYERPRTFFRGGELLCLMTMIVMLGVLAMLILRAGDASTWHWLTGEGAAEVAQSPPESNEAARLAALDSSSKKESADNAPAVVNESEIPQHDDSEEADALKEELELVSDRSLTIAKTEMPAYWRLMSWSKNQSVEGLKKRAQRGLVFNDFVQTPKNHRGQLVRVDLNIRRVLSYPAEEGNPAGVSRVYEVWGWSNESQAWLYATVTSELPAGMPQGTEVDEKATFYGYFFKLQGYHEAGAKPNARPLVAPLFVGKFAWQPARATVTEEPQWAWWLLGGAALVVGGTIAGWFLRPRSRPRRALSPLGAELESRASLNEWLSETHETDGAADLMDAARNNGNGKHD